MKTGPFRQAWVYGYFSLVNENISRAYVFLSLSTYQRLAQILCSNRGHMAILIKEILVYQDIATGFLRPKK